MRRGRTFFNWLVAAAFVIFLAGAALWVASSFGDAKIEFPWRGARWEAAYRWGFLSLNNGPQRRAEEDEYEATRSAFVHGLGWGTADYRRALAKLHQWEARQSAPATPEIDHRLPLWELMAGLLLLPGIWLARRPRSAAGSSAGRRGRPPCFFACASWVAVSCGYAAIARRTW